VISLKRLTLLSGLSVLFWALTATPAFAQTGSAGAANELKIIVAAAAAAVALAAFIWILFGPNAAVERDLSGRLGQYSDVEQDQSRFKSGFMKRFVRQAESVAERRGMLGSIETALEQANMPIRPGEAIAGVIGLAVIVSVITAIVLGGIIGGLVGGFATLLVAAGSVNYVARRERNRFIDQLPDTLNLISTSLRAGYSLLQSLEAVASEAPQPTAREFGRALTETRLGRPPVDALKDVAARMESVDFDWAVLAISIQREVGGNLAEVLQTAAETMLHRNRLRREMKALTAEGRISAIVLGALPLGLFLFLYSTNRDYLEPLFTSTAGIAAMVGAMVLLGVGIFWLTRIVRIEV
jgi:tight adherence protein B